MEESSKTETQIKELMGLVENFGEKRLLMYLYRTDKNFRVAEDDSFSARQTIESKLRAMLGRKPLSEERIWEIEAASTVSSRRPEYTKDCWGDDKTIWHETKSFSFPLFARNIERAHGIGGE